MAGVTRADVRARLARMAGDHIDGTFTSVTGTTGVDTVELVNHGNGTLAGKHVFVTSGTGSGQERLISGNTQSTGTITVPTWGTNPTSAAYEIHGLWRVRQYNEAINQAINDMKGDGRAKVTQVADVSVTMTATGGAADYYLPLPAGLVSVHRGHLLVEGPQPGIYDETPLLFGRDWGFEKVSLETAGVEATYQVVLSRWSRQGPIEGRRLRIIGAANQPELASDTALVADQFLPFVLHRGLYWLLSQKTLTGTPAAKAHADRVERHWRESEAARARFDYYPPPGTVTVPW